MNDVTCPCGKAIDRNRHVCKSCWDVAPAALKTSYTFWQSRPDSALFRKATEALTDFCELYAKDRQTYSIEMPSGLVGKLNREEQIHLARLLERRAHLRARLHASPDFNPFDQAEAQSLEWAVRKIENLALRIDKPVPSPANNHQPPTKCFIAPASIEEGERLRDELVASVKQMSERGGQSQQYEVQAQLRELKAWLHTQRQLQEMKLIQKAFTLLSEAVAKDDAEAGHIRQTYKEMAREFFEQQEKAEPE